MTTEGFRRARTAGLTADQVGKVRRAHGIGSLRTTFRQHSEVEGHWPLTKYYLIPVDPALDTLLDHLQTDVVPALCVRHGHHQPNRSA